MSLPHFNVLCDLVLNRHTPTWNLFVLYNKETNYYSYHILKSFNITRELAFAHFGEHEESHLNCVLNEKSISDGGNLCPLWLVILKSSLTYYQRHLIAAVGCEL